MSAKEMEKKYACRIRLGLLDTIYTVNEYSKGPMLCINQGIKRFTLKSGYDDVGQFLKCLKMGLDKRL